MKKYIILSFDDNTIEDRIVVSLLNKYGLHGTFHINSGTIGTKNHIDYSELRTLYNNHEISSHTMTHPNLPDLQKNDILREIGHDMKTLSKYSKNEVRGMSYPFGNYNEIVLNCLKELGVMYARTVDDTFNFQNPENFLIWNPTAHYNKVIENDLLNNFIKDKNAKIMYIWTHSWEFNSDDSWRTFEEFLKQIYCEDNIISITSIDYYLQEKAKH